MCAKSPAFHPAAKPLEDALLAAERIVEHAQANRQKCKAALARNAHTKLRATLVNAPRWAALAEDCAAQLVKHGARNQLARQLGVTRQCIYQYFTARTSRPDAERTLMIVEWLAARREGRELAP